MDKEFKEWLSSRPKVIQDLATLYPHDSAYKIKEGAPYGISRPGVTVYIVSYLESGEIGVVVTPENKTEEVLEHERQLGELYNKTKEEMETLHKSPTKVDINPKWLEKIEEDPN